ncbi:MAG TPA: hypothetical protein VE957_06000 [Terriglobales bacterium]|nr:hypothetical protein [Terriglobales bacterium]
MKVANRIIGLAVLLLMTAQLGQAQLGVGENTKLNAGGLVSFGYAGDYGDAIPSSHGLNIGVDGKLSGYYYNPNFISFTATPYYNESRADSSYQSLTGASGIDGTANFFTGSNFPGSVSYRYDRNSTGQFGLAGQPNFTTYGTGQGFGINWSALLPNWPTLSVGYSQGSGDSTIYGTSQEANSSTHLFNLHSSYQISGFRLTGYYTHNSLDSKYPEFLAGEQEQVQDTSGHDFGFGAQHNLPMHGSFSATYNRASASSDYQSNPGQNASTSNTSSYTDSNETATAIFHPTQKFSFDVSQNYTGDLSGYLAQNLGSNGVPVPGLNLGSGSDSSTLGGGLTYQFTNVLSGSAQATYYDQHYFGKTYSGEYLSGTVSYNKRLLDMFTFSASVIDSSNGQGTNALGFIGNVNFFRRIGRWQTSGQFSYGQNVQTLLVTYTTSYYQYSGNLSRRLPGGIQWIATFNGNHSGLTQDPGNSNHSEGYSTSLGMRRLQVNGFYAQSSGVSLLGAGGLITPTPTPGLTNFVLFSGSNYGAGISVTPLKRLVVAGAFSRSISDTISSTTSHNNTEVFYAQMQYHVRRIGLLAGYTRFAQGISAIGAPVNTTSYFVGITRWFDFF